MSIGKTTITTEHKKRVDRMIFIYHFYLLEIDRSKFMDEAMNKPDFNFDEESLKILQITIDNLDLFIDEIEKNLKKGWKLNRLPMLERAILIQYCSELKFAKTDRSIIINESVELAKEYGDDNSNKYINAVVDSIKSI